MPDALHPGPEAHELIDQRFVEHELDGDWGRALQRRVIEEADARMPEEFWRKRGSLASGSVHLGRKGTRGARTGKCSGSKGRFQRDLVFP